MIGFSNAQYKGFFELSDAKSYLEGSTKENTSKSEAVAYVDGSFLKEKAMFLSRCIEN